MAIGAKINETRPRKTKHRGDICIHAAMKLDIEVSDTVQSLVDKALNEKDPFGPTSYSCIIAIVELWDVLPSEDFSNETFDDGKIGLSYEEYLFGNYAPGRYIYRTRNLRCLKNPVPCRGFQCIGWTVPPEIEAKVIAELP